MKTKTEEEETEAAGYEGMEAFARAIEIGICECTCVQTIVIGIKDIRTNSKVSAPPILQKIDQSISFLF